MPERLLHDFEILNLLSKQCAEAAAEGTYRLRIEEGEFVSTEKRGERAQRQRDVLGMCSIGTGSDGLGLPSRGVVGSRSGQIRFVTEFGRDQHGIRLFLAENGIGEPQYAI